jgi:hypothetical protein
MSWFQETEEEIVKDLPTIIKVAEAIEETDSK